MEYLLKKYLLGCDFRMTVYRCEHNGNYEQHSHHDFYELVLVRSGKAEHVLENNRRFFVSPKESDCITAQTAALLADAIEEAFSLEGDAYSANCRA